MPDPVSPNLVFTLPQTIQLVAAAAIPIGFLAKWLSFRERRWRFSSRKTKALRRLLKGDAWRDVPPIELQYAFQDAFGRGFDPADLAFIEGRQRPLVLIQDRLTASTLVRLNADGTGFERTATSFTRRISLTVWGGVWSSSGWCCAMLAVFLLIYAFSKQEFVPGVAALDFVTLAIAMFFASRMCDAAQRVVSLRNHEEVRPIPPKAKRVKRNGGRKRPASSERPIGEKDATPLDAIDLTMPLVRNVHTGSGSGDRPLS